MALPPKRRGEISVRSTVGNDKNKTMKIMESNFGSTDEQTMKSPVVAQTTIKPRFSRKY